jgi:hypothetical protein
MATLAVTNDFSAGAAIVASEMNTNFSDVETFINSTPGVLQLTGGTVTGAVTLSNTLTVGANDTGYDVKFFGATATTGYMLWDESENNLIFGDASEINLGTGLDLKIYANGSHSFIDHDGDGELYIRARGTGEDMYIDAKDNLNLQTDSSTRLAIDSSGVVTIASRKVPGVYYGTSSRGTALTITHNGMLNIDTALNITIDCAVGDIIEYTFDTYVATAANIAHFLPYTLNGTSTVSMLPIGVQTFGPAFWLAAESASKSYTYTYKTVTADVISDEVTVGLYCNTANVAHDIIDANIGFRATLTNLGPDIS